MARTLEELGVKRGDRVAYIGPGFEADWARIAGVKIVAEVPVIHERQPTINRIENENAMYVAMFFELSDAERETVYRAFRQSGAVIAVAQNIPNGGRAGDWKRVVDPNNEGYPKSQGQVLLQTPGYYRWLTR
jgi:hypothetical protein